MSMFCYQCQETAGGTGCKLRGVCGKTEEVAKLQDLLIYTVKGISALVTRGRLDVDTLGDINREVLSDPAYEAKVIGKIPAGFIGEPSDVAGLVVYLASEAARYVTGATLLIDGGLSL